jgi:S1-C subfamily serine protease
VVAHANRIRVRFDQEIEPQAYEAKLVSHNASEDLALLKIEVERALEVVRLGSSSDIELGERVVAIGNPYGEGLSVSAGIVSALHRDLLASSHMFRDLIQTDASINPGNSGGPLLNMNGELIGINTIVKQGAENVGYAIPVDTVRQVLQDQLLGDAHARAWLGFEVEVDDVLSVKDVFPDGPAALAGLLPGDRLVAFNGAPLESDEDFHRARLRILPNEVARFTCRRGEAELTVELRGWDKVDGILFQRVGITLERFAVGRASMVRVHRLSQGGAAARLGLMLGDVIEAVRLAGKGQAWRIQSPADFAQLIAHTESGTELELDVLRDEDGDGLLGVNELYKGSMEIE